MDALTARLGVNSNEYIITMNKPVIKDTKKWLGDTVDPNNTTTDRVDCSIQTMQAIDLLAMAVQELSR